MPTFEGLVLGSGKSFAVVASRYNEFIVSSLVDGAVSTLRRVGVREEDIWIVRVPGAFEIPPVAERLADSGKFHAVLCLGAVIRGATPHFDYVASESAKGISNIAQKSGIPVIYGVLTTDTIEQAVERAGTKAGNRGAEAALAAVELADLYQRLPSELKKSKR
jgi:6,7-dimethyl-8-ribityllumazine synthase